MSSYHPENDPANPDQPGKGLDGTRGAGSKEPAGSPNPDPAEGNVTGLEPGGECRPARRPRPKTR